MKLILSDINYLKNPIDVIHGLVIESRFTFNKEGISLLSMDPAGVCFIYFKIIKDAFNSYVLDKDLDICLKVIDLKNTIKKSSESDILIIEYEEPRLILTLKGKTTKIFKINTINLEEKDYKEPKVKFDCLVKTKSSIIKEAINACNIGGDGESLSINLKSKELIFHTENNNNEASCTIKSSNETEISCSKETISKISIDYLNKVIEGSKLSENITLELSTDYPLKVNYVIPDRLQLYFIIAPRIETKGD